jgi:hypothetical protein
MDTKAHEWGGLRNFLFGGIARYNNGEVVGKEKGQAFWTAEYAEHAEVKVRKVKSRGCGENERRWAEWRISKSEWRTNDPEGQSYRGIVDIVLQRGDCFLRKRGVKTVKSNTCEGNLDPSTVEGDAKDVFALEALGSENDSRMLTDGHDRLFCFWFLEVKRAKSISCEGKIGRGEGDRCAKSKFVDEVRVEEPRRSLDENESADRPVAGSRGVLGAQTFIMLTFVWAWMSFDREGRTH